MKKPVLKRKRTVVIAVVLVAVVAGGIFIWQLLNQPATGTVSKGVTGGDHATLVPPDLSLSGKYFHIVYPSGFGDASNISQQDPNALEQYRLTNNDHGLTTIVVSVAKLPQGGLSEVSSYKLRKIQPTVYTESHVGIDGSPSSIMTKTDGSEATAFIPTGGMIATIAVTSSSPNRSASDVLHDLAASFEWLQQ